MGLSQRQETRNPPPVERPESPFKSSQDLEATLAVVLPASRRLNRVLRALLRDAADTSAGSRVTKPAVRALDGACRRHNRSANRFCRERSWGEEFQYPYERYYYNIVTFEKSFRLRELYNALPSSRDSRYEVFPSRAVG